MRRMNFRIREQKQKIVIFYSELLFCEKKKKIRKKDRKIKEREGRRMISLTREVFNFLHEGAN